MKRSSSNKRVIDKSLIVLVGLLMLIGGGVFAVLMMMRTDPVTTAIQESDTLYVLISVHNEDGNNVYTNLFLFNIDTGKGALVDIPGNIGTRIPEMRRIDKLDLLYDPDDMGQYKSKVGEIIGVEIPFYLLFDLNSLEKGIDLLDGIEVFIPNPVEHQTGKTDDVPVLIPSGSLVLDGAKGLNWLLLGENDDSDLDAVNRRQRFTRSFLLQLGEHGERLADKMFSSHMGEVYRSNMGDEGFFVFARLLKQLNREQMVFQRVLGALREVDEQELLFPHYDGNLIKETVEQTVISLAKEDAPADEMGQYLEIEILNGTNTTGLANRTRQIFESFGYSIAHVGNAPTRNIEYTVIIDRTGDGRTAQALAQIIRCTRISTEYPQEYMNEELFDEQIDESHGFERDITIILGNDFDGRYCIE